MTTMGRAGAKERVCAVVVTHEQKEPLARCLAALGRQTRPVDATLVVDNASTDETSEMVGADFPDVKLLALASNQGGATGFHEGLKAVQGREFDWVWLLHGDTVPAEPALAELLRATVRVEGEAPPHLVASKPIRGGGELDVVSLPRPDLKRIEHAVVSYEHGLQPLRWATFVSLLVSGDAIAQNGLPIRAFSGRGGELEFTARLLRQGHGYLAPRSVVEHDAGAADADARTAHAALPAYVSDRMLMLKSPSWGKREKVDLTVSLLWTVGRVVRSPRLLGRVLRAVAEGALRPVSETRRSGPSAPGGARP